MRMCQPLITQEVGKLLCLDQLVGLVTNIDLRTLYECVGLIPRTNVDVSVVATIKVVSHCIIIVIVLGTFHSSQQFV